MRNLFLSLAGVALFIVVVGVLTKASKGQKTIFTGSANPTPTPNSQLKTITIGNNVIQVVVANNQATRERGLGGVTNLPPDQGMLFVFDSKNVVPGFWMKDMHIPLDFIWITGGANVKNGKVSQVDLNVPPPAAGTADNQLPIYRPNQPIDYVLEVNGGYAVKNNVNVGDSVDLSQIF